jgi:hypothetical protein
MAEYHEEDVREDTIAQHLAPLLGNSEAAAAEGFNSPSGYNNSRLSLTLYFVTEDSEISREQGKLAKALPCCRRTLQK